MEIRVTKFLLYLEPIIKHIDWASINSLEIPKLWTKKELSMTMQDMFCSFSMLLS